MYHLTQVFMSCIPCRERGRPLRAAGLEYTTADGHNHALEGAMESSGERIVHLEPQTKSVEAVHIGSSTTCASVAWPY